MTARILEKVQSHVSGKSREYLSDPIYTVRDGRYVIPVKSEHRGKVRGIIHDTSGSGQTVFVEPEDVLQIGNQIRELEGAEREEIQVVLQKLSAVAGSVADSAIPSIARASELDLALGKARLAFDLQATAPVPGPPASIKIEGGRHPMLDAATVVPVSLEVGRTFDGLLITGPNTGGKTVAIKCVGLFVLMAQCGLFLPARDVEFGVFSQIWADIGDEQSISQSLSTFSGHIRNISEALKGLKAEALVLFDEIGAGTDPSEGAALAKVLLRHFQAKGAKVVASTHYGELKAFAYSEPGFQNAAMEFDSKSLRPTFRVILGAPGASHALKIAERFGIPSALIEEAKIAQGEQDRDIAEMLEKLEEAQKQARQAQSQADRRTAELKEAEETARRKLAEADEIRRTVHEKASETIESALRELRIQAAEVLDELKKSGGPDKAISEAREKLKSIQSEGAELAESFATSKTKSSAETVIAKGASVRIDGYSQTGILLSDPKSGTVAVQIGPLRLTVPVGKVIALSTKAAPPPKSKSPSTLRLAQSAPTEIHVRGMRAEEALERVERFVDDAILAGLHQVRIVHGKGEGILRSLIQKNLRSHRGVSMVRDGDPAEGGSGATIVQFA
jgi:DNA mismatch repair protein MutS2